MQFVMPGKDIVEALFIYSFCSIGQMIISNDKSPHQECIKLLARAFWSLTFQIQVSKVTGRKSNFVDRKM